MPKEWTFSRAFAEFSISELPSRIHESLINNSDGNEIVGHLSRDSTAIEAREKPVPKKVEIVIEKKKLGRPKKGEERLKEPRRLDKQMAGWRCQTCSRTCQRPVLSARRETARDIK